MDSLGQIVSLACQLEVCAPKPGNVHRGADFEDMQLIDFLASATAIGPVFDKADEQSVGQLVLSSIHATRRWTSVNTNLGILLLLAPLAKVPRNVRLVDGIHQVLDQLDQQDAVDVFEAIRIVQPGGLDPVERSITERNVRSTSERAPDLFVSMQTAAAWDRVAEQYANGFDHVLNRALPWLLEDLPGGSLSDRIVATHVRMLSEFPDTLIGRKCGWQTTVEASARAGAVLAAGPVGSDNYYAALADFDFWLRSDGHRRNPGTTADLMAAALFAAIRDEQLPVCGDFSEGESYRLRTP